MSGAGDDPIDATDKTVENEPCPTHGSPAGGIGLADPVAEFNAPLAEMD